jgi:HTH-type transcriptional regulator/antitoxin MqsA
MEHCPVCDGAVVLTRETRDISVGMRTVAVEHEFHRCEPCAEEFFEPEMMDAVLRRATNRIREEDGLLTPREIADLRRTLGYTQAEFETILNSGAKTVTRWERGTVAPTGSTDTLLRVLRKHPDLAHELAGERGIGRPAALRKKAV